MIILKKDTEIQAIRRAGKIINKVFKKIKTVICPGITTEEIDRIVEMEIRTLGGIPAFLGYKGFPKSSCISVNEEVIHGIPDSRRLNQGDIVSVDIGVMLDGYYADGARTFPVGSVKKEKLKLISICSLALTKAISIMKPGIKLSEISRIIQTTAESNGFSVVRSFVGHGIGLNLHEDPQVPNFVSQDILANDVVLEPGIVLAIEPMLNMGTYKVKISKNGWTAYTADGKPSAHFEDTVALTQNGPLILTGE